MSSKRGASDFLSGLRTTKEEHAVVRPTEVKVPQVAEQPAPIVQPEVAVPGRGAVVQMPVRQKGREGKVSITHWVDPVVRKQVARIALDEDKDQYELMNEALNLLFEKYGRSTIA